MNALQQLDPVFEHRARLAVAVLLAAHDEMSFARFRHELEMTDGNLGAQLRRLEDAGYIALRHKFADRRPITWYRLTSAGRSALEVHLDALKTLIAPAVGQSTQNSRTRSSLTSQRSV